MTSVGLHEATTYEDLLAHPGYESRALHPAGGGLAPRLAPGDPVEVQNRFDGGWCTGFEVVEVLAGSGRRHYRIRRRSDGAVLPRLFEEESISPRG